MLYVDSAMIPEVKAAIQWGWVTGVTTNPTLLAKSELSPEATLKQLKEIVPGEIYYQLTAHQFDAMVAEARAAIKILGGQTVLKIPATALGFEVTAHLSGEVPCAVTAIYSPAQAAVAREAGAKYAIAYVNRATRLLGDGMGLVREMAAILGGSETKILAASIKSPPEAVATLQAGAEHLTLPYEILKAMTTHDLSEKTAEEFAQSGVGLSQ